MPRTEPPTLRRQYGRACRDQVRLLSLRLRASDRAVGRRHFPAAEGRDRLGMKAVRSGNRAKPAEPHCRVADREPDRPTARASPKSDATQTGRAVPPTAFAPAGQVSKRCRNSARYDRAHANPRSSRHGPSTGPAGRLSAPAYRAARPRLHDAISFDQRLRLGGQKLKRLRPLSATRSSDPAPGQGDEAQRAAGADMGEGPQGGAMRAF